MEDKQIIDDLVASMDCKYCIRDLTVHMRHKLIADYVRQAGKAHVLQYIFEMCELMEHDEEEYFETQPAFEQSKRMAYIQCKLALHIIDRKKDAVLLDQFSRVISNFIDSTKHEAKHDYLS